MIFIFLLTDFTYILKSYETIELSKVLHRIQVHHGIGTDLCLSCVAALLIFQMVSDRLGPRRTV